MNKVAADKKINKVQVVETRQ